MNLGTDPSEGEQRRRRLVEAWNSEGAPGLRELLVGPRISVISISSVRKEREHGDV